VCGGVACVNRSWGSIIIATDSFWRKPAMRRKRLALINLLIAERAKDRLAAQRASDRAAMTAVTIAKVLGTTS
jgi:hypothetical protein